MGRFCLIWLVCLPGIAVAAGEEFPYAAIVEKHDSEVRSGPGKNFYATDKLDEGAKVEVYRHDPGGWAAIRPPDGSFSWLRARYIDIKEDGLAEINTEDVVARIGSSLVSTRDVIQVHLEEGEQVELVDGDEEKPGSWRKIAPPSGEFRWVKLDAIRPSDEPGLLASVDAARAKQVDHEEPADDAPPEDFAPILPMAGEMPLEDEPAPSRLRRLSHTQVQQEIVDIDCELSNRAAEEITTWQFDDLHRRAERALEGAPTALDRAAVRELMSKLDRFEQLCERHNEVQIAAAKRPTSARLAMRMEGTEAPAVDTSKFDGMGKLTQITARGGNTPQYALVDGAGQVRYYLNPAPGINLKPFLNKQVGINGTRGALASKKRQVISAQRITELPGDLRRF